MMESCGIVQKVVQGTGDCSPFADSSWSAIHNLKRHAERSQPAAFALAKQLSAGRPVYLPESLGERLLKMLFAEQPVDTDELRRDAFWPWMERLLQSTQASGQAVGAAELGVRASDIAALARRGLNDGKLLSELAKAVTPPLAEQLRCFRANPQLPDADPAFAYCYLYGQGAADAFLFVTLYGEWLSGVSVPDREQVAQIKDCRSRARKASAEEDGSFVFFERVVNSATPMKADVPPAVTPPPLLGSDQQTIGTGSGLAAGWRRFRTLLTGWFRSEDEFYPGPVQQWYGRVVSDSLFDEVWQSWRAERWYDAAWIPRFLFLEKWYLPVLRWIAGESLRESVGCDLAVLLLLSDPPPPHRGLLRRLVRAIYRQRRGFPASLTRERVLNLLSHLDACRYPSELTLICLEASLMPNSGRLFGLRERLASLLEGEAKAQTSRQLHAALRAAYAACLDAETRYRD